MTAPHHALCSAHHRWPRVVWTATIPSMKEGCYAPPSAASPRTGDATLLAQARDAASADDRHGACSHGIHRGLCVHSPHGTERCKPPRRSPQRLPLGKPRVLFLSGSAEPSCASGRGEGLGRRPVTTRSDPVPFAEGGTVSRTAPAAAGTGRHGSHSPPSPASCAAGARSRPLSRRRRGSPWMRMRAAASAALSQGFRPFDFAQGRRWATAATPLPGATDQEPGMLGEFRADRRPCPERRRREPRPPRALRSRRGGVGRGGRGGRRPSRGSGRRASSARAAARSTAGRRRPRSAARRRGGLERCG